MKIQRITSQMLSKQPDQTAFILNKVIDKANSVSSGGGGGDIAGEAVTTAKLANGAVTTAKIADGAVTSGKIDWTTLNFGNYSTSEQDTGFTWIDGKHIYKKTLSVTNIVEGANSKAHGITNFYCCLKYEGFVPDSGLMLPASSQLATATANNSISIWTISSSAINIYSSINVSQLYITLYYIKTS